MTSTLFALDACPNIDELRRTFEKSGHIRLQNLLLDDAAREMAEHLAGRQDWIQLFNSGSQIYELDRSIRAEMPSETVRKLDLAIQAGARDGFQYRYETIRVSDSIGGRLDANGLLSRFAAWLSTPAILDVFRAITGFADIVFADAQATAYSVGDFLTAHDDRVDGKDRRAAFVFSLNPIWRPEWGGLLLLHGSEGHVDGWVPALNTLDIMRVPKLHSVSLVAPAAGARRYSITGWLRAQQQPV